MIDVYAAAGTFGDAHALAKNLATELMTIEQVPDIPMFRKNTAAFVHELPSSGLSNVDGEGTYVRVQVLTNAGALDRDKQLAVVSRLPTLVADAAGDSSLADRTWVLLTEAPDGGWVSQGTQTRTRHSSLRLVRRSRNCRPRIRTTERRTPYEVLPPAGRRRGKADPGGWVRRPRHPWGTTFQDVLDVRVKRS
jgi:phenylpyruvate tautomerase PptA (4-oxalocrotonate tautomerase family)